MNPLDDHELSLGFMRVGLTHTEARLTVRHGLDAGHLANQIPTKTRPPNWRLHPVFVPEWMQDM